MDYVYHPIEPLAFGSRLPDRWKSIGTINVAAMAAEMQRSIPGQPVHRGNYDWTGFYIGAHVGNAWSKTSGSTVNTVTGAASRPHLQHACRIGTAAFRSATTT